MTEQRQVTLDESIFGEKYYHKVVEFIKKSGVQTCPHCNDPNPHALGFPHEFCEHCGKKMI